MAYNQNAQKKKRKKYLQQDRAISFNSINNNFQIKINLQIRTKSVYRLLLHSCILTNFFLHRLQVCCWRGEKRRTMYIQHIYCTYDLKIKECGTINMNIMNSICDHGNGIAYTQCMLFVFFFLARAVFSSYFSIGKQKCTEHWFSYWSAQIYNALKFMVCSFNLYFCSACQNLWH